MENGNKLNQRHSDVSALIFFCLFIHRQVLPLVPHAHESELLLHNEILQGVVWGCKCRYLGK